MSMFRTDNSHGGSDTGAVGNGLVEKDINLYIGSKVKYHIERHVQDCGINRICDTDVSLDGRVDEYYIVGGPENYEIGVKGAYVYHFSREGRLQSAFKALE